jgi:hypothetical protein
MQRILHASLTAVLLAAAVSAQQTFLLPTLRNNPTNNHYPFAGPTMRYQQWFSALEWQQQTLDPIRVIGMGFLPGPGRTGVGGRVIDIQVEMANARPTTYSGVFDSNFVSGRTMVYPRASLTLQSPASAAFPVQISFRNEFVWDGVSGVVVDIKIFDNGNGGQPYTYDLEYNAFTLGQTARLFTVNDPIARSAATVSAGTGLSVQFRFFQAISWPYGQGCAGAGGAVPLHEVEGGFPIPGNASFGMLLTRAAPQANALFLIGGSSTSWNGTALPFDLAPIGAPGCSLLAEYVAGVTVPTGGGSPGTGIARLPFPMPSNTSYLGASFYSQWLVLDPNALNGVLAASNGLRHIVAVQ